MATFFPSEMGRITGLLRLLEARKKVDPEAREAARDLADRAGRWAEKLRRLQELAAEVAGAAADQKRRRAREELLAEFFTVGDAAEAEAAPRLLAAALPEAREAEDEAADTVELARFFEDVASSIVATQQALDRRSLDYVRDLDPQIAPTHFAVPNLKAEMKVGFRKIDSRGINLVLFSKRGQKEAYGESTLTFEVAAAPPPPGSPLAALPSFVARGGDRERVLDAAEPLVWPGEDVPETYARSRDRVLVLLHFEASGVGRYLVVWPARWLNVTDPEVWPELRIFGLREDDAGMRFDDVFESASDVLHVTTANKLLGDAADADALQAAAREVADLAVDLGDAIYNVVLIVEAWLAALLPPEPGGG